MTRKLPSNLIVFDGICFLCSSFARFIAHRDKNTGFRFVDAHSDTGRAIYQKYGLDPDKMETNIVVLKGTAYTKMASFTAAMSSLGWPWRALSILNVMPKKLSDWIYDRIAQNRYRLGRRSCPLPSQELKDRLID